ncbi:UDP-sugar pyrophosphorylase 1 [Phytophthora fragariae]|uniref:UTP-monosaccharide-1-phosphate uridylyltransferase n=2 Tax=Phytophthora fragariae TaxID=53985 RepID=A0A6A3EYZ6_9STRA|nr:UDP-sugar pyrophosphorylase 1 [Phytophthora fragariae]KAE8937556.1 UDP-sugar pyrophosphorylase 1 [Phytophthora fragariae]KAE9009571.1 UDP-sugar pyrophosphorylase 1 [Phytophthora fragariae]KAE9111349.1 UDP-sugar pyrophosphorylase 1 [Phytophthora fragariae]KAE9111367.1 UDP-sugar pyrophosphorylase 1 [Phytophthora fragariae]
MSGRTQFAMGYKHSIDDDKSHDAVLSALQSWDQQELLSLLADKNKTDSALWRQVLHFDGWYKGGVAGYLSTATKLYAELRGEVADEQDAGDVWADWRPSNPAASAELAAVAELDSPLFAELEQAGLANLGQCCFVVVAGGLGERLGYQGIKLRLPVETLTHTSYLEAYVQHLLAMQALANAQLQSPIQIPLAIMTSDSTHEATQSFLTEHKNFGMAEGQLVLIKQEKVPCVDVIEGSADDGKPKLKLVVKDGLLVMKPHGHGDVHTLLHTSGLAAKWLQEGKKYVHFIQDTNYLILNGALPMLGACVKHNWGFAFTTVPRKAKDASGGIVRFTSPSGKHSTLFNVEYHELDQFLRTRAKTEFPDGDVNDPKTGFSPFPGNINGIVAALDSYVPVLEASKGFVPEVFNPKFRANANKCAFKSPARLECMMQDYPKLLVQYQIEHHDESGKGGVGLVQFPSSVVYSPCKNDAANASEKAKNDIPPQCASSAEHEVFAINRLKLRALGVSLPKETKQQSWLDIPVDCSGPQVVFGSGFALSQTTLAKKFTKPSAINLTARSTLFVEGADVTFDSLELDGAVRIVACPGAKVEVKSLSVKNAGVEYESVPADSDPVDAMRGYRLKQLEVKEFRFDTPGNYVINE